MEKLPYVSPNGEIEVIKYSDKSAFIRGTAKNPKSTFAIKDRIKSELNASWNKFLKDPKTGGTFAAWLIGQSKVAQAIELARIAGGGGAVGGAGDDAPQENAVPQQAANGENNDGNAAATTKPKHEKVTLDDASFPILSADGQIECIKYNDNCMAVRGIPTNPAATTHIKEKLKSTFAAKFNGSLKDHKNNDAPFTGWIVFNSHFEDLKNYLQNEVKETPIPDPSKVKAAPVPNDNPPAPALFTSADGKVKCIRYSEKSICLNMNGVRDDTLYKHVTDESSGFRGKYVRNLTDPGNNTKFAGIIFGNNAKDGLKDFLTRYHVGSGKIPPTRRGREEEE